MSRNEYRIKTEDRTYATELGGASGSALGFLADSPDQSVQDDHGHQPDSDDDERGYRGLGQLFVRGELKRPSRQRIEVEGAENQCEWQFLENVDENQERRADERALESRQIHLP